MIACIVLPYFAAAIEWRDKPVLRRGPILVCQGDQVYAVSSEARQVGVQQGMALRRARALCPMALVVEATPSRYRKVFEQVLGILSNFTHLVEPENNPWAVITAKRSTKKSLLPITGLDSQAAVFYLNLETLREGEITPLAGQMIQTVKVETTLTPSVGLANGKFPARLAAVGLDTGAVRQVASGSEAAFLGDLPIDVLPADTELIRRLRLLGIETLGQIAALPAASFGLQFGKVGLLLRDLSCGRDNRPLIPYRPVPTARRVRQFESAINNWMTLQNILRDTAADLAKHLQAQGLMTRRVELSLTLEDGRVKERWRALRQGTAQAKQIAEALEECLSYLSVKTGVINVEVSLTVLVPAVGRQLDLFAPQAGQDERQRDAVQQVMARYSGVCYRLAPAPRKSKLLGRRFMFEPAGEP